MEHSDAELLARLSTDSQMFGVFYRRHFDKILAFIVRRVLTAEDAADLTQAVFVAVIEGAERFDAQRGTPVGWLYGIANNTVAAWRRSRSRAVDAFERLIGHRLLEPDEYAVLEDRITAARASSDIAAAMQALPESQRLLLELVSSDGLTPAQAAEALGIGQANARMRLSRARRSIRQSISTSAPRTSSVEGPTHLLTQGNNEP